MTTSRFLVTLLLLGALASGCGRREAAEAPPAAPAAEAALTPEQELARFCRVCVVDHGERVPEYLPSRLDTTHDGKTYRFCRDDCREKFDAGPARYAL